MNHKKVLRLLMGVGYFFVWTVFGMPAFALGVALATVEMQQPALLVPTRNAGDDRANLKEEWNVLVELIRSGRLNEM